MTTFVAITIDAKLYNPELHRLPCVTSLVHKGEPVRFINKVGRYLDDLMVEPVEPDEDGIILDGLAFDVTNREESIYVFARGSMKLSYRYPYNLSDLFPGRVEVTLPFSLTNRLWVIVPEFT